MIEFTFLKEIILIKQGRQKSMNLSLFLGEGLKFQPDVCNGCHGALMMPTSLSDIAISIISGIEYRCIINGISKVKP